MKAAEIVVGAAAGLAVGVIVGILFAPQKGSRTRQDIVNKSEDYLDELKDKYEELQKGLTDKYNEMMKEAEMLVSKGKNIFENVKKDIDHHAPEIV